MTISELKKQLQQRDSQIKAQAVRKYKRIVQMGTQNRSAPYNREAKKYIEEGKLGKIHFCRVYDQKQWDNFPVIPNSDPPQGFDWDLYNGPATLQFCQRWGVISPFSTRASLLSRNWLTRERTVEPSPVALDSRPAR